MKTLVLIYTTAVINLSWACKPYENNDAPPSLGNVDNVLIEEKYSKSLKNHDLVLFVTLDIDSKGKVTKVWNYKPEFKGKTHKNVLKVLESSIFKPSVKNGKAEAFKKWQGKINIEFSVIPEFKTEIELEKIEI
jgi:hypothetical protein